MDRSARFNEIYRTNEWNSSETRSGRGSDLSATEQVVRILDAAIIRTKAVTLLDAGCGECHWLKNVQAPIDCYRGIDIVGELTSAVDRQTCLPSHWRNGEFLCADIVSDTLPDSDLILCRDVLPHFSYADILMALKNMAQSGARYILTTSFSHRSNFDIETGRWRPVNFEVSPFNFPEPMNRWYELCPLDGGKYFDKSLNLWSFDSLKLL